MANGQTGPPSLLTDGSLDFSGGVNSLVPTTIASSKNPNGLKRNQLAWLKNATVRGGGITTRAGWIYRAIIHDGSAIFQGGSLYEPIEDDPYLVTSIGGRIYRTQLDGSYATDELVGTGTANPPTEEQAFFCQGEEFLVIQAGDNVTLPLFWDGTTLRRSIGNGLVYMGYVDEDSIDIPIIDGVSQEVWTMNIPYAGAVGDIIVLKFEGQFRVAVIAGNDISVTTISSPYAGLTVYRGVVDAFGIYQRLGDPELPAATCMDYFMGRIWYARGRTYTAGDIVRGPSGSLPYDFRDSILKVTENPLAIGGDGFTVPSNAGNIRSLTHTSELDTPLGEGKLYVGTRRSIYRVSVPVSRSEWIAAADATQPLQTVIQTKYGPVGDRCVVPVNSDLFYQTMEPGIRSLALAVRNFGQYGNVPISRNENRVLRFNDRSLMRVASGIEFDNRLWQTSLPLQTPVGIGFQSVVPLDFDLISTLEEKLPPAWEGMYEGLTILQLYEGDFGGLQRAFAVIYASDGTIQVWELTREERNDTNLDGEARVTSVIEFPAYTWNQEFLRKKLVSAELWFDRIYGEVLFTMEYRPDGDPCWYSWSSWIICSTRNTCEDVNNPVCYPIAPYPEGFRQTITLPLPQNVCQLTSARPANVGYQFQTRLTIKGFCRLRGLLLYAEPVENRLYHDGVC